MRISIFLKVLLPIFLIFGGGFIYVLLTQDPEVPQATIRNEQVWTVNTVRTNPQTIRPRLRVFGQVTIPTPIELRTGVSGFVAERVKDFVPGTIVEKGQILVTLDQRDLLLNLEESSQRLAEAQAQLEEITASLSRDYRLLEIDKTLDQLAQNKLQRQRDLQSRGVTSADVLDTITTQAERARRVVAAGEANISILEASQKRQLSVVQRLQIAVKKAELDLEYSVLRVPETAFVESVFINTGSHVSVNQVVGVLLPIDSLEVEFRISTSEYARLINDTQPFVGRPVEMSWTEQHTPSFQGYIKRIHPRIEENQGGILMYASVPQTNSETFLRPGLFLEVSLEDAAFENTLRIPTTAIMPDGHIYFVSEDNRLTSKVANILLRNDEDVLIEATGIDKGQCIVTTQFNQIGEGVKVEPIGCTALTNTATNAAN